MEKFSIQQQTAVVQQLKQSVSDYNPKAFSKPAKSVSSRVSSISIGESELLDAVNEVPKNTLSGLTFVLSGVFQEIGREKLESFITEHGGRCTSAISGKTDYLVVGFKLEDGREVSTGNKYKTAIQKKITIFTESEFESFIKKKSGNDDFQFSVRRGGLLDLIPEVASVKEEEAKGSAPPSDMWTERYKPKTVYDLIGNKAVIDQLYEWLKDWDEVCIRGNKKPVPFRKGQSWQDQANVNARAALLSGPPGIGKTSTARIICASLGYEVVE